MRTFNEDFARLFRNTAFFSAHDARQRQNFFFVRYHNRLLRKGALSTVQGFQPFAFACRPNAQRTFYLFRIERMQRLPLLEENKIGNINNIIDWTDTGCFQERLYPFGARSNGNIFNKTSRKIIAQRRFDRHKGLRRLRLSMQKSMRIGRKVLRSNQGVHTRLEGQ